MPSISAQWDRLRSEGDLNLSPLRRAWAREHLGREAREWIEEDATYFLHQSLSSPCLNVLRGCRGTVLEDIEGREILDFHGNSVHQVGFGHPRVVRAAMRQMRALSFCPRRYTNEPAVRLARKLAELAPGDLDRVLFAPAGSLAMSMAIRLARAATGRFKTVSMWDSFHGASLDTISVGGEAIFRTGAGPLLPGCEHVPPPDHWHCPFRCGAACNLSCADYVEYILRKEGDVAAVIAETVRYMPYLPPPDYWKAIRRACDRHGALLILDEIPTCLGRTGRMFACEHYDIVPDMLVLGKGLGGGLFPLAALLARGSLNRAMPERALGHFTHEKNPVACAASLEAIEIIEKRGFLDRVAALGGHALAGLRDLQRRHAVIGDVRGLGLLLGVELFHGGDPQRRASAEAERILYGALRRGLNFKVTMGNILSLAPPLTAKKSEIDSALRILDAAFAEEAARGLSARGRKGGRRRHRS